MSIKPFDVAIIILCTISITIYSLRSFTNINDSSFVKIEVDASSYIYPLDKNLDINIPGVIGETKISINHGEVGFIDSPCKNKTCIKMGFINRGNQSTACLPNRVLITIIGEENNEVDIIAY